MITTIPDRERALQAQVDALKEELARLQAQEPVAMVFQHGATVRLDWASVKAAHNCKPGPLYAAPPAQPAEPVQRLSDERAAFEAWHNEYRTQELVRRDDTYYNTHVRCRWEGWQARAIESALQTKATK